MSSPAFRERRLAGAARTTLLLFSFSMGLFVSISPATCFAQGVQEGRTSGEARPVALDEAIRIADADSATAAILRAVKAEPGHPLAAEAIMRAGFISYVKGDAYRAHELFDMADEAGNPRAKMWGGLALLSAGRIEAASRSLLRFAAQAGGRDAEAVSLALAACDLAEGELQAGEAACRRIIDSGGEYSVAASLLLRRSAPGVLDREENDRWVGLLAQRHPLSCNAVLARHLSRVDRGRAAGRPDVVRESTRREASGSEERPVDGAASGGRSDLGGPAEGGARGPGRGRHAIEGVKPEPAEASARRPGYSVQVGAFADIRNAESVLRRLLEKGYEEVRIETETRRGVLFHCVRVGRFSTREDALAEASALKASEGLGTTVVEREPG